MILITGIPGFRLVLVCKGWLRRGHRTSLHSSQLCMNFHSVLTGSTVPEYPLSVCSILLVNYYAVIIPVLNASLQLPVFIIILSITEISAQFCGFFILDLNLPGNGAV